MAKKTQLNEMISLINRMDKPQSGWATLLQESIDEYKDQSGLGRREFTSFDDFMSSIDPIGGQFVGVGYIQNYEVSKVYPEKPINGVPTRDVLSQYQQGLGGDNRLSGKLGSFLQHPEMTEPTGRAANFKSLGASYKSVKEGNPFASVLKITSYNFQWRNYANAVADKNNKIGDLRVKHGFGQMDDMYPENDWRRNPEFGGVGRMASFEPKRNDDGSEKARPFSKQFNQSFNVYSDNDERGEDRMTGVDNNGNPYQKRVMKALIPMGNGNSIYCTIDTNGEIDDIDKSLFNIFGTQKNSFTAAKISDEMAEDEKAFRRELADFENQTYNPQWFLENIAYMVGVGKDKNTGEKVPYRLVNKNIIFNYKVDINPEELSKVINNCSEKAYRDVMEKQRQIDNELYNKAME